MSKNKKPVGHVNSYSIFFNRVRSSASGNYDYYVGWYAPLVHVKRKHFDARATNHSDEKSFRICTNSGVGKMRR